MVQKHMTAVQVDALKQKVKPTPVIVTPVQTPPVPVHVSGLAVSAPPPVGTSCGCLSPCMNSSAWETPDDSPAACPRPRADLLAPQSADDPMRSPLRAIQPVIVLPAPQTMIQTC